MNNDPYYLKTFLKLRGYDIVGKIDDWYRTGPDLSDTSSPFIMHGYYSQDISDFRKFSEGSFFHTSQVVEFDEECKYVLTKNSAYLLGNKASDVHVEELERKRKEDEEFIKKYINWFF
jgi:hypothetical protein